MFKFLYGTIFACKNLINIMLKLKWSCKLWNKKLTSFHGINTSEDITRVYLIRTSPSGLSIKYSYRIISQKLSYVLIYIMFKFILLILLYRAIKNNYTLLESCTWVETEEIQILSSRLKFPKIEYIQIK